MHRLVVEDRVFITEHVDRSFIAEAAGVRKINLRAGALTYAGASALGANDHVAAGCAARLVEREAVREERAREITGIPNDAVGSTATRWPTAKGIVPDDA